MPSTTPPPARQRLALRPPSGHFQTLEEITVKLEQTRNRLRTLENDIGNAVARTSLSPAPVKTTPAAARRLRSERIEALRAAVAEFTPVEPAPIASPEELALRFSRDEISSQELNRLLDLALAQPQYREARVSMTEPRSHLRLWLQERKFSIAGYALSGALITAAIELPRLLHLT